MFSNNQNNQYVETIHTRVSSYNQSQAEENQIRFVHGSSSAVFAFFGRKVTVRESGASVTRCIPMALIPTGMLRKKYGVYPVTGELEIGVFGYGSRKRALNFHYLSGVSPTITGIKEVVQYAQTANRFQSVKSIHEAILSTIANMNRGLYLRSLKMLLMHMTNMLLLSEDTRAAAETGKQYLQMLDSQYERLKECQIDGDKFENDFKKYSSILADIISLKNMPFMPDRGFMRDITDQYPVIFCSNIQPMDFTDGVPDEQIYRGEVRMDSIKMVFTNEKHVNDLRSRLNGWGYQAVLVESLESGRFENDKSLNRLNTIP